MTEKILIDRSVVEQALEAFDVATTPLARDRQEVLRAQAALRAALEQPQVEQPVAWIYDTTWEDGSDLLDWVTTHPPKDVTLEAESVRNVRPLYLHPQPKREPLTDVEILMALDAADIPDLPRDFKDVDIDIARAIEIAHGIGE